MTTEHTPGPWVVVDYCYIVAATEIDNNDLINPIASVRVTHPDCEANCALIAAAPDLLAALESVEWASWNDGCPSCAYVGTHGPNCTLDAALQKARGES